MKSELSMELKCNFIFKISLKTQNTITMAKTIDFQTIEKWYFLEL